MVKILSGKTHREATFIKMVFVKQMNCKMCVNGSPRERDFELVRFPFSLGRRG